MERRKLIILEGGDGLGKTTTGQMIVNNWGNVGYVKMPAEHGHFAPVYNFMKKKGSIFSPLETQLFLTLSNFATMISITERSSPVYLCDRSPLSTLAYLLKTGETELLKIDLLIQAINAISKTVFNYKNPVDIKFVVFQGKPFKNMNNNNVFEKNGSIPIDQCYNIVLDMLSQEGRYLLSQKETYQKIDVTGKREISIYGEVYDYVKDFLSVGA